MSQIGVIDTAGGGTPLAAFTGMNAISEDAGFMPAFANGPQDAEGGHNAA